MKAFLVAEPRKTKKENKIFVEKEFKLRKRGFKLQKGGLSHGHGELYLFYLFDFGEFSSFGIFRLLVSSSEQASKGILKLLTYVLRLSIALQRHF